MMRLPVAGSVLAGGQSSRMEQDKALLVFDGETLVERAMRKLDSVCQSVAIAGGALERYGRVVPDARPGCGPLGGIVAALEWVAALEQAAAPEYAAAAEWCLFLPVDVPLVSVEFLRDLALRALATNADAVVPRSEGRLQPLCAAYRLSLLPALRSALLEGRWKVMAAVEAAGRVEVLEVDDSSPSSVRQFANVNTPEEFSGLQQHLRGPF